MHQRIAAVAWGSALLLVNPSKAFPKTARMLRRWEFQNNQKLAKRVHSAHFVVAASLFVPDRDPERPHEPGARLGMAVSKKVGPAVVRNRLRRLIREVFREIRGGLPAVDLVVIARPSAAGFVDMGLDALAEELVPQLQKAASKLCRASGSAKGAVS